MDKREIIIKKEIFKPQLTIRAATPEEEVSRVSYVVNNLKFYKEHKYKISLPSEIEQDVKKSPDYYPEIIFVDENDGQSYDQAVRIQEQGGVKISTSFEKLNEMKDLWGFNVPSQYSVVLSKYGTSGSYDATESKITRKISGLFVQNVDIAQYPIHEIVHIGVENFCNTYKLTHSEKEGLVDGLCISRMKDILPNYTVQSIGNKNIFNMVSDGESWKNIPDVLDKYVEKYPR